MFDSHLISSDFFLLFVARAIISMKLIGPSFELWIVDSANQAVNGMFSGDALLQRIRTGSMGWISNSIIPHGNYLFQNIPSSKKLYGRLGDHEACFPFLFLYNYAVTKKKKNLTDNIHGNKLLCARLWDGSRDWIGQHWMQSIVKWLAPADQE